MTDKEALDILLKTDRVGVNLIFGNDEETIKYNQDSAEALYVAIKALEVVEKIKKAFIESDTQYDKADILDCNNCTHFTGETYNILCTAYGTEEDRESWMTEYKE